MTPSRSASAGRRVNALKTAQRSNQQNCCRNALVAGPLQRHFETCECLQRLLGPARSGSARLGRQSALTGHASNRTLSPAVAGQHPVARGAVGEGDRRPQTGVRNDWFERQRRQVSARRRPPAPSPSWNFRQFDIGPVEQLDHTMTNTVLHETLGHEPTPFGIRRCIARFAQESPRRARVERR